MRGTARRNPLLQDRPAEIDWQALFAHRLAAHAGAVNAAAGQFLQTGHQPRREYVAGRLTDDQVYEGMAVPFR
jgi:hypothetical protein